MNDNGLADFPTREVPVRINRVVIERVWPKISL